MLNLKRYIESLQLYFIHFFNGDKFKFHGSTIIVPREVKKSIRRQVLASSKYEVEEIQFVEHYVRAGMDVVELGGSIGGVSSVVGGKLRSGDTHVIVEAVPHLAKLCEINARARGGGARVKVLNGAISYDDSEFVLFLETPNAHIGRIAHENEKSFCVPSVKLSDILADLDNNRSFVLVCDIEGAEYEIFKHDLESLKRARVIIIELHETNSAGEAVDIPEFLSDIKSRGLEILKLQNNVAVIRSVN